MFEDEEEEEEGCEEGHDDDVNVVTPDWLSKYLRPKIGPVKMWPGQTPSNATKLASFTIFGALDIIYFPFC